MRDRKSKEILIFRIFCLILLLILGIKCGSPMVRMFNQRNLNSSERKEKQTRYSKQYFSLFKENVREQMTILSHFTTKSKANYTRVSYKDHFIYIHRVDVAKYFSLATSVSLEKKTVKQTSIVFYAGVEDGSTGFLYSFESFGKIDKLIIAIDTGPIASDYLSDSLLNITCQPQILSYRYSTDGAADMVFTNLSEKSVRLNIVILQKENYIVIMTATPKRRDVLTSPTLIKDLLK